MNNLFNREKAEDDWFSYVEYLITLLLMKFGKVKNITFLRYSKIMGENYYANEKN